MIAGEHVRSTRVDTSPAYFVREEKAMNFRILIGRPQSETEIPLHEVSMIK